MSWGSRPKVLELIRWVCTLLLFSHVHFVPHSYLFSIIPLSPDCSGVLIPLPLISLMGPLSFFFLGMIWLDFLSFEGSVCVHLCLGMPGNIFPHLYCYLPTSC